MILTSLKYSDCQKFPAANHDNPSPT